MKLKTLSPYRLSNLHDRACARLAQRALADVIHGGASALVLASKLIAMKCKIPAEHIVSSVYTSSQVGDYGVYECPECGSAHLGTEAAYACCNPCEEAKVTDVEVEECYQ